jgi:hypothetical protein
LHLIKIIFSLMKSIVYISIILINTTSVYAQDSETTNRSIRDYQEQYDKGTPQEKKLDASIFIALMKFEHLLLEGVPREQAISSFAGFQQDDSSRIYVVIKIHGGNGDAQSAIGETGGHIRKDNLGSIYSWVKPEALRSLIKLESIVGIERFHPPMTR